MGTRRGERGVALLLVLWSAALMAFMALGIGRTAGTDARVAARLVEVARAEALAEAGLALAAGELRTPRGWPPFPTLRVREHRFGDAVVRLRLADEYGKVDLNEGRLALVEAVFTAAGLPRDEAAALTDAVESHALPDGPRGRPFARVADLLEVPGMTAELYARVREGFTVYTRNGGVDPYFAPTVVLDGLGIGHLRGDIELAGGMQTEELSKAFETVPELPFDRSQWRYFTIAVEVELAGGTVLRQEAVLDLGAARRGLPTILEWNPAPPPLSEGIEGEQAASLDN
jgi:general secretion pathway protein K